MKVLTKVAIIIPFYQEEKGILKRAILSVLAQKNFSNYEIIVIDDGSPAPAEEDIKKMSEEAKRKLKIIKQKNKGPGAARNRGLDEVSEGTKYVAFLDSDDEWTDTHLEDAVHALERGYDFYFSDFMPLDEDESWFCGSRKRGTFQSEKHEIIDEAQGLFELKGDFFDSLLQENFIATPTVVYRYDKYKKLRFQEDLCAGEVHVFWLKVSQLHPRTVFLNSVRCFCGEGVNVWQSVKWGTDNVLDHAHERMKWAKYISRNFMLNLQQKRLIDNRVKELRRIFVAGLVNELKNRRKIKVSIVIKQLKLDFLTYAYLPMNIIAIGAEKCRR